METLSSCSMCCRSENTGGGGAYIPLHPQTPAGTHNSGLYEPSFRGDAAVCGELGERLEDSPPRPIHMLGTHSGSGFPLASHVMGKLSSNGKAMRELGDCSVMLGSCSTGRQSQDGQREESSRHESLLAI
ncbi:hypothetical protein EYF80_011229 [Liparis tanakae]|uniref:Uncharacterized protein n=1 Tax=Liparis tanakae TaxID=230148 RepID=A0A4Z2IMC5_9TELE|nr:hypothetical protein EYF80_011229 [Liparis tanakae]